MPVWFLADSGRTDLALIDPVRANVDGRFRLPFTNRFFMSGARPHAVNWYQFAEPGWMAGEGWALTPETAGIAWRHARGPGLPSDYRLDSPGDRSRQLMMIGGRNLGQPGEPDVRFEVTPMDGA